MILGNSLKGVWKIWGQLRGFGAWDLEFRVEAV